MPTHPSSTSAWIIVPVHNRRDTTLACLETLARSGDLQRYTVLIVDDGSTDGTSEAIRARYPNVELLHGDGNLWWTGGVAKGMEHALKGGADFLIWLNDDARPDTGAIDKLIRVATERKAVCGGFCRSATSGHTLYAGYKKHAFGLSFCGAATGAPTPCDALNGNLVVIPRDVCDRIGLPDARHMPHYLGDIDYTLRVSRVGIPVLLVPDATAVCDENTSVQYKDWLWDPTISIATVWKDLLSPRHRSYLPAQFVFKTRHWGLTGLLRFLFFIPKLTLITLARPVVCTIRGRKDALRPSSGQAKTRRKKD